MCRNSFASPYVVCRALCNRISLSLSLSLSPSSYRNVTSFLRFSFCSVLGSSHLDSPLLFLLITVQESQSFSLPYPQDSCERWNFCCNFKVDVDDGTVREVLLTEKLVLADGISVRGDGVVLVVSPKKLWFLKSQDSWGEGVVYDKIELDEDRFPTSVTVAGEDRIYVLYGSVEEGLGGNVEREMFSIEEMRSEKESKEENVWVFVLIGLGLAYFLFWRFQMRQLIKNMDKKTN